MQRSVSTSRGITDIENQQQEVAVLVSGSFNNPRRRIDNEMIDVGDDQLPVAIQKVSGNVRKAVLWCQTPERLIHIIPVLMAVCFFILWWFSSPAVIDAMDDNVVIKQVFLKEVPAAASEIFNTTTTDMKPANISATAVGTSTVTAITPNPSVSESLMAGETTIADISPQQLVTGND